ncbi:MAG: LutB/LldF family L-lactate oxidation iron-sulfur protein [Gammaproteobacteria bacterium]|nr:LutB/LldF family L-lactate oxidation iron-sulfur protein [Gammaproteobacteria bacterium]
MRFTSVDFERNVTKALQDEHLQDALQRGMHGFVGKRAEAVAAVPEFERLRDEAREIKNHTLEHLDYYLESFEESVVRSGGHVHWAVDAVEARGIVLDICRKTGAKSITKGKSMAGEEIDLNEALEAEGFEVVETDLGEYIIQLANEPPSHIIAPAVHKTREQVSDLFHHHHRLLGFEQRQVEVPALVDEARQVLRKKFLQADVGITGANFLIAETGSNVIVTNEGNGDLTSTLPRVHVVTAGIEKVVPTLEDMTVLMRVLARSATGQEASTYTTIFSGPRRPGDADGPEEFHVVLIDSGRTAILGTEFQDILRCIRCGACLNHCPVWGAVGGHAYGWCYSGPMGAVLTPLLKDLEAAKHLPNACTLNGRCEQNCPVRIPLPGLLRKLRHRQYEANLTGATTRYGLHVWAFLAKRPALYDFCCNVVVRLLHLLGKRRGRLARVPLAGGWTRGRDLPAPAGATFQSQWRARGRS